MDNKTYLLLNNRDAYNALLLDEVKDEKKDVADRLKAVDDYVKANKGKEDKIATLKDVVASLPAEERVSLANAAKNEIAKTAAGQQKVAYRKEWEAKEAKETFDFFYQKNKAIYLAVTGKPVDEEALIVAAAKQVAPNQTPEQLAETQKAIRQNIDSVKKQDVKAPKHNVENDKPEALIDSMVSMLSSFEKRVRGNKKEDKDHADYMAYLTDRQKTVYAILSGNDDKTKTNVALMAKKLQQGR